MNHQHEEEIAGETEGNAEEPGSDGSDDEVPEVDTSVPPDPGAGDAEVESIQVLLVKESEDTEEPEEDASPADGEPQPQLPPVLAKDDRTAGESGEAKVVPPQETEFVCRNCFLVKHRSQLANKKKQLCRDCA